MDSTKISSALETLKEKLVRLLFLRRRIRESVDSKRNRRAIEEISSVIFLSLGSDPALTYRNRVVIALSDVLHLASLDKRADSE